MSDAGSGATSAGEIREKSVTATGGATATGGPTDQLRARVIEVLRSVFDPEIPVNIYELGLVYEVNVDEAGSVKVRMTLTAPACPVAGSLPGEVEGKIRGVPGVTAANVELVWEPPWGPDRMTEEARLQLGFF